MARTVFFSFHYDKDWSRLWNVRNSEQFKEVTDNEKRAKLWAPRDVWEDVKKQGDRAIKNFINEGMKNSSVTVVLIGSDTYDRKYVKYEIEQSELQNKGMLGVYIHGLKDMSGNFGTKGPNPFNYVNLSKIYKTYDWVNDKGAQNFGAWVEQAAREAGR